MRHDADGERFWALTEQTDQLAWLDARGLDYDLLSHDETPEQAIARLFGLAVETEQTAAERRLRHLFGR
ncbi:hypothetical protein [Pseudonocardia ammonioxydans]|uniref:hypothetical protein n=1 Tax=Pseudonocardia ammonioxydans TaxID=260086 RepID=UPI000B89ACB4|nr:hypothetical protein [Pseudonocardia ammonioxydans]